MLAMYRAKLQPMSGFIFDWQADSIFGALCEGISITQGAEALSRFLNLYTAGTPPLVLSNGYPLDWLPRPYVPPQPPEFNYPKDELIRRAKKRKAIKDRTLVSLEGFNQIISGNQPDLSDEEMSSTHPWIAQPAYHNMVDRFTGTTGEEGSLYVVAERFTGAYISIYMYVEATWAPKVEQCLHVVGEIGVGRHKSWGKGSFHLIDFSQFSGFVSPGNANAFTSLSNFVPAASDPTRGFYRTLVKYGKVGTTSITEGYPYKNPLLMIPAGAVFFTEGLPRQFYGRLVESVYPSDSKIVQYGLALAIPARIPDDEVNERRLCQ